MLTQATRYGLIETDPLMFLSRKLVFNFIEETSINDVPRFLTNFFLSTYSRVPNKQTGRLLENEKKSHLYAFIQTYMFINFQQKVSPIHLFPLTLLLIFVLSMASFDLKRPQKPL